MEIAAAVAAAVVAAADAVAAGADGGQRECDAATASQENDSPSRVALASHWTT